MRFVKDLDLGIDHILSEQSSIPLLMTSQDDVNRLISFSREATKIKTVHKKYDAQGNDNGQELFELEEQESAGTRRLFSLAVPILTALNNGYALFIDEMDARLHPLITCTIVELFNNKKTNPKNAQLIFTTHDTNLLSNKLFRRDQIWFTEKDKFGATHLYSLAEFKIRNDASFERDYIHGRYGAIPFIGGDLAVVSDRADGTE